MQVFVTGATGVMGSSVVSALLEAGHDVHGLARIDEGPRSLSRVGRRAGRRRAVRPGRSGRPRSPGCDVVCNLATHVPVGFAAMRPGAWRVNDRIRAEGSRLVAEAARAAGVRRLVQESVSLVYADGGEEWLTEDSPVVVNRATEPMAMAEAHAQEFASASRDSVVLRFGGIIGDDDYTRWRLARARAGQPVGLRGAGRVGARGQRRGRRDRGAGGADGARRRLQRRRRAGTPSRPGPAARRTRSAATGRRSCRGRCCGSAASGSSC